jgi:hypothetical protein
MQKSAGLPIGAVRPARWLGMLRVKIRGVIGHFDFFFERKKRIVEI